jgi:hypothetical protein
MTPPGDYLEFQENPRSAAFLNGRPEVREAIHALYSSKPHSLTVPGRLLKGELTVAGQRYTFLLMKFHITKVSLLILAEGEITKTDLEYYGKLYK